MNSIASPLINSHVEVLTPSTPGVTVFEDMVFEEGN